MNNCCQTLLIFLPQRRTLSISVWFYPRGFGVLLAIVSALAWGVSSATAAPPPNDNFENRITLAEGVTATADIMDATVEPGERDEFVNPSKRRTVWYTWTASTDAMVAIDNIGTNISNRFVVVYMGDSIDKLAIVAIDSGEVRLSFPAKAGTVFQITAGQLASIFPGGESRLTLNTGPFDYAGVLFGPETPISIRPTNDNFANRSEVGGSTWTAISYLRDATIEGGEPDRPFSGVDKSVWFKWTAPADAEVTIDTTGSTVSGHFFAVYVGDSISDVAPVAGDTSSGTSPATSVFLARAGVTYAIAAGTRSNSSGTMVLTLTTAPPPTGSLLNLSTRMAVGTGNNVLIGGFIITGGPKRVMIRGIGPSLAQFRIANSLSDPYLELHDGTGELIAQNNNWQDDPTQAGAIQNSGLAPTDPRESALLLTLDPGNYTAILGGVNNSTGVGLVEVYDTEGTGAASKAVNVSTRGFVSTGDSVMIAGFIVGGDSQANVILRGIGPSLAASGIVNALQNPELDLYDENGRKVFSVDNWQDVDDYGVVIAAGLAPSDSRECAVAVRYSPGNYTVVLRGINNTSGIGLIEVYNLRPQ